MLLMVVMASVFYACSKDNESSIAIIIEKLEVLNTAISANTARIEIELNTNADAFIRYWIEGEAKEMVSEVSSNKKKHLIPLFKLKENTSYRFEVIVSSQGQFVKTNAESHQFTTASIPEWVKDFYNEADNQIEEVLPGYYIFSSGTSPGCIYILDQKGNLAWYRTSPNNIKSFRMSSSNTLLTIEDENNTSFGDGNVILETTLAGDTLFYLKKGQKGFDKTIHHDLAINNRGNLVLITNELKGGLPGDGLIELDKTGQKVWEWSTFDVQEEIDPKIVEQPWINSISVDNDNNYILSLRALHQIWKVNSTTRKVIWKLGTGGNVKIDPHLEFLYQHFAYRNKDGHIMLFDNGSGKRPFTRVLSFDLNEQTLEAESRINTNLPENYYSPIMGSASLLPDQHLLATSATNGTIVKMDQSGRVIWKLNARGPIYRTEYLDDPFITK